MKIELEADIPEGYEPTGDYRTPRKGELYCTAQLIKPVRAATSDGFVMESIILRKKEPLAIQACRKFIKFWQGYTATQCSDVEAWQAAWDAIKDYENGGSK